MIANFFKAYPNVQFSSEPSFLSVVSERRLITKTVLAAIGITNSLQVNQLYNKSATHGVHKLAVTMTEIISAVPNTCIKYVQEDLIDVTIACLESANIGWSFTRVQNKYNSPSEAPAESEGGNLSSEYIPSDTGILNILWTDYHFFAGYIIEYIYQNIVLQNCMANHNE